eukprot:TRINITY_DN10072_c0_g1_i1.p1 TRINITY_DN10072_c0_g1~~TRINITY_DN10072_c0_g1_i1.p1  ORF type:complete len:357 (+),score=80.40 TRINITY_DN10072_c0_g1_i1:1232-2302(+)
MSSKKRKIGYAAGFSPPTPRQIVEALGSFESGVPAELVADPAFYGPLPKPSNEGDWLAQIDEEGQTYDDFLEHTPWISKRKSRFFGALKFDPSGGSLTERFPDSAIYLQPIGAFPADRSPSLDVLAEFTAIFFGLPVKVLDALPVVEQKEQAFVELPSARGRTTLRPVKGRFHRNSGARQLLPDGLIDVLRPKLPADALFVIGVTMEDLYLEPSDLFVAGWAGGNNRVGAFSFHRYDPGLTFSDEHWWEVTRAKRLDPTLKAVLTQRCCKLLVHEAAHILGVEHCIYYDCIMNGSGHLEEDFRQSLHLCPVDLRKLQTLCGFSALDRFQKLQAFYDKHLFASEAKWTAAMLQRLTA